MSQILLNKFISQIIKVWHVCEYYFLNKLSLRYYLLLCTEIISSIISLLSKKSYRCMCDRIPETDREKKKRGLSLSCSAQHRFIALTGVMMRPVNTTGENILKTFYFIINHELYNDIVQFLIRPLKYHVYITRTFFSSQFYLFIDDFRIFYHAQSVAHFWKMTMEQITPVIKDFSYINSNNAINFKLIESLQYIMNVLLSLSNEKYMYCIEISISS